MAYRERIELNKFLNTKEFFDNSYHQNIQSEISEIADRTNQEFSSTEISDYLVAFSNQWNNYCVGCVDMVNSTKISASISPHKLSIYYEIFLNSISKIIGMFGGKVIKNVGDCLLYYFPNSAENSINDSIISCLDCGLAIAGAKGIISQQLLSKGLPNLNYRISADYGSVLIMNTTYSTSIDLIGPPVNMCTRINHYAKQNEFVIGGDFFQRVKKIDQYSFQQVDSCNVGFKHSYPVYNVIQR
jgi:class 3 adenylate cyclase